MKIFLLVLLLVAVACGAPPSKEEEAVAVPTKDVSPTPADAPSPPTPADTPAPPAKTPEVTEAPARAEEPTSTTGPTVTGACHCAAFKIESNAPEEMIGNKTMKFTVDCNAKGKKECKDMCVALAEVNKLKAPKKTCDELPNVIEGIKPTLYSRVCDAEEWVYTGTRAIDEICCREGKPTPCKVKKENKN